MKEMKLIRNLLIVAMSFIFMAGSFGTTASMAAPNGWPDGTRKVAVLSDVIQDLSLQFLGSQTVTVDTFHPAWHRTSRGYEAVIEMPIWYFYRYQSLRLTGSVGDRWSHWHEVHTKYLRHNNVTQGDPACVGGKAWCAVRGL